MSGRRVGLIGAGMALPPWLDALSEHGCEVVTVATRRPDRFQMVADRFPAARQCWPPQTAFDADVDLILDLSPASRHLEGIRMAAAAGVPIVLEKPLEITYDRGVEAILSAHEAGVPLAVCFQYRYQEGARALKEAIDAGLLGEVEAMTMELMWWRGEDYYSQGGRGTYARDGGGVLLTQAVHALDLVLWYLGMPTGVIARMRHGAFRDIETEDVASALLEFPNGCLGTVVATTGARSAEEIRIRLLGSGKTAVLTGNELELFADDGKMGDDRNGSRGDRISTADPMSFPSRWHTRFLGETLSAFESGERPPIDGGEALRSLALIDAMERSARDGGAAEPRPLAVPVEGRAHLTSKEEPSDD